MAAGIEGKKNHDNQLQLKIVSQLKFHELFIDLILTARDSNNKNYDVGEETERI